MDGMKLNLAESVERYLLCLQVPGWDPLLDGIKLDNAWVFAKDDSIPGAVKAFLDFEKRLLEPFPKPERAKLKLTDIPGTLPTWHISLSSASVSAQQCKSRFLVNDL